MVQLLNKKSSLKAASMLAINKKLIGIRTMQMRIGMYFSSL